MSSITPTIGRKVWFWMSNPSLEAADCQAEAPQQAFDATVIFVHEDGRVNLQISDHTGTTGVIEGVPCREYEEGVTEHGGDEDFYTWMPYQTGQAKKDFAEAKREEAGK